MGSAVCYLRSCRWSILFYQIKGISARTSSPRYEEHYRKHDGEQCGFLAAGDNGVFHRQGIPALVFGPGSPAVIHKANEYCNIDDMDCDFIIVHGAGLLKSGDVTPLLAGRLDKGIDVFHKSGDRARIIVSGGQGADEVVSEAFAMKKYLLEKGIPEHCILMEDRSTTTYENMYCTDQARFLYCIQR